jgi:BirA family biotin operon repressor/biotin-[acetyl-CoA-carboxylase] ligase
MKQIKNWIWQDNLNVVSTNDDAKSLVAKLKQPCIVSALEQTGGRGRRGNSWVSQKGNLFASFAFEIKANELCHMVILSAVAVLKTISHFIKDAKIEVKWPNDVLVNGEKISGILFEKADDNFWVMGVGINIVSNPELVDIKYNATSLHNLGIYIDRLSVLEHLTNVLDKLLEHYQTSGFSQIKQTWLDNAYNLGNAVLIKQEKQTIDGIFLTIDDNGAMVLKTNEEIKKILVGDLFVKES